MSAFVLDVTEFLLEFDDIERTHFNRGVLDTCHMHGWHKVLRELVKEAALVVGSVRPAGWHINRWFEAAASRDLSIEDVNLFYSDYLDRYVLSFSEQLRPRIAKGQIFLPDKVKPADVRYGRLIVRMALDVNIVGQALEDMGHDQGQFLDQLILDY